MKKYCPKCGKPYIMGHTCVRHDASGEMLWVATEDADTCEVSEFEQATELLMKHAKHAPNVALLDYIRRDDEYIVLYRDDGDVCTPYIIHHLTDSGLYYGRYYGKGWVAWLDFAEMKRYYTGGLT